MIENTKYSNLIAYLKKLEKVAVAFSGGVDSSFLVAAAKEALGDNVCAITVDSPALPRYELEDTKKIAALVGVKHLIVNSPEIEEDIKHNPVNRCYLCKKVEFGRIRSEAEKMGIAYVLDGSNFDDLKDYRPGMKATREVKVLSPLLENKITKAEIRQFSKELNLPTWNKPAYACLYSRIPYGNNINKEDLEKIEKSEKYLIDAGFKTVRVRCHGNLARIEVAAEDRQKLFIEPFATELSRQLKAFGFKFIAVDLQGYRMGSLNEVI